MSSAVGTGLLLPLFTPAGTFFPSSFFPQASTTPPFFGTFKGSDILRFFAKFALQRTSSRWDSVQQNQPPPLSLRQSTSTHLPPRGTARICRLCRRPLLASALLASLLLLKAPLVRFSLPQRSAASTWCACQEGTQGSGAEKEESRPVDGRTRSRLRREEVPFCKHIAVMVERREEWRERGLKEAGANGEQEGEPSLR
eukprot:758381-Hanusia_phi.AAC.3